jgi:phosphate-selective porin OprO/OprP
MVMLAGLAYAGDADSSARGDSGDKVARLEALLDAQQQKIESLEQRLAGASAQDQDAARVEAMKQQIREVLSEQEFRESLMPSMVQAGYDNGFFIKSSDEKFLMKVNGRLQLRWTHYGTGSRNRYLQPRLQRDDRTGFEMQRIWVVFSGHAYTEDLTYKVVLDTGAPSEYSFRPFYAYANYRFQDELQFQAGLMRIQSTRTQVLSDAGGQFPDRNMVDAVFGFGRGIGVQFWGQCADKQVEWYIQVLNSLNGVNNRVITNDPAEMDNNPALVFRTVWHALGVGDGSDFKEWGDLEFHDSPALDLGFHYAFNEDEGDSATTRIPFPLPRRLAGQGGFGLTNTNGCQINQFGFDAHFKWMGFSAVGEYMLRMVDPRRAGRRPFAPWWLLTNQGDTTVQHGAFVQAGYFLPIPGLERKIEAVARVGGISTLANGQEGTWEYAAGLNYYIEGNKVKLQTDVTKITEVPISSNYSSLANVNDDALIWRVQLQVAF